MAKIGRDEEGRAVVDEVLGEDVCICLLLGLIHRAHQYSHKGNLLQARAKHMSRKGQLHLDRVLLLVDTHTHL